MADKEKLVELLLDMPFGNSTEEAEERHASDTADYLIANVVTVQEWISVKDRLPEKNDYYLCCVKSFCFPGRTYINILDCDKNGFKEGHIYTDAVTHWMPLPQPPKGE